MMVATRVQAVRCTVGKEQTGQEGCLGQAFKGQV